MTEMQTSEGVMTQISSDDFSTLTQEDEENGSVTRLEVLVVDGNWETSELEHGHLVDDINQSQVIQTNNGQILTPINLQFSSNQNYNNEIQHFWEPPQIIPQVPLIKPSCSRTTNQFSRFQENNNLIEDQENGNLSWLLDFKLDSLIEAADDRSTILSPKESQFGEKQENNFFLSKIFYFSFILFRSLFTFLFISSNFVFILFCNYFFSFFYLFLFVLFCF